VPGTLDIRPDATSGEARAPLLDEDYLILSTIHSAKGQEWTVVFVLNTVDGCIPSDLAQLKQLGRWTGYFCGAPAPKWESNQRHRLANRL
jgi:superfamily I DNA/RNA helicase